MVGSGGAAAPPQDVRRSDDSAKGGDYRRSDDSAKGAVISANILKISGGVGRGGQAPMMLEEVVISRQVQYFRKVRSRFRGRRSTFARGTNFAAGAALSRGAVPSLTQAQH